MTTIIGLSGSLRRASYNTALLRTAAELAPAGCTVEIASIREIPLYDGDLEAEQDIPQPVAALKNRVAAADGLLLVTPEYNNSIPGVFKNVIDWLSRPAADIGRVFGGKPVGLIGATPGGMGTAFSQTAWLPVLRTLGTLLSSEKYSTSPAPEKYSTPRAASRTTNCANACAPTSGSSRRSWRDLSLSRVIGSDSNNKRYRYPTAQPVQYY